MYFMGIFIEVHPSMQPGRRKERKARDMHTHRLSELCEGLCALCEQKNGIKEI